MSHRDPDEDPDPEGLRSVDIIQNLISTCVGTYKNKDTT